MPATVYIPTPLRPYVDHKDSLELEGATVEEVLKSLTTQYEGLRRHLYGEDGRIRNFVNIYINDEDIRYLQREKTPVQDGDTISIVPSIAGGATDIREVAEPLSREEIERYSRHLIIPEVGMEGQRKLKASSVLCIGAGGLGAPVTMYLAAAGVGRVGIVDFDVVDYSNLQRQIIHSTNRVGDSKLDSARDVLQGINPNVQVEAHHTRLSSENALELFREYDLVIDGTDNFPTRYLVNDACVLTGKPNVYGSIFRFEGQASIFAAPDGPCYRCLYPEPPPPGLVPSCAEGGVLGILPGLVGLIQATEAIKWLLNIGEPLVGRLLLVDALGMKFRQLRLRRNPDCPVCGDHPTQTELIDYEEFCGIPSVDQQPESNVPEITVHELKAKLDRGDDVFILDVRNPQEYEISRIEGAKLIPLDQLMERVHELDSSREIVLQCRTGQRSAVALQRLQKLGFRKLHNLKGGILEWSREIDPTLPRY
ncbi:MAG TPA: molybdopterin-synthase adenylyltransferase MoeB [Acidobacteriota bacterium]|nr:molybdopterin-synthase adenylyltransferase MoeB [Acidobacteriota bacterium]